MARDRQRAKQRKARRAQNPGPAGGRAGAQHRENVPGELEHASGEVDRFEAELISGAGGEPVSRPGDEVEVEVEAASDEPVDDELVDDEVLDDDEPAARGSVDPALAPAARGSTAPVPTRKGAGRFVGFIRASWAELQRVQWPDRRQVGQATAVVLGFVVIAGAYLGLADRIAQEIVDIVI